MEVGRAVAVLAEGRELAPSTKQYFGWLVAGARLTVANLAEPTLDSEEVLICRARIFHSLVEGVHLCSCGLSEVLSEGRS